MSMFDSFFKQRFDSVKCKTLLKLTIPRIKLLRNRREVQLKQMRRDIAKLLETGQEATARIRVEHILREEKMMAAQEIVELFCELISVRLPIIEAQRECPLDLKEAISSICFAAPRSTDLTELLQVQMLFAGKYGKEFVDAATNLMPECGVNRQLVELLSVRAHAPDVKLKLLKEIAEEHGLEWDPSASENELLKRHEDLLNGPTQFFSGSKLPFPQVKLDDTKNSAYTSTLQQSDNSDDDFEIIEFPEVPVGTLQANKGTNARAPEMLPFPASAFSEVDDQDEPNENSSNLGPENIWCKISSGQENEDKKFLPFVAPPSQYPASFPTKEHNLNVSLMTTNGNLDLQEVLAAAHAAAESAEHAAAAARSAQLRLSELVEKNNDLVLDENSFHLSKSISNVEDEDKPTVFDDSVSSPTCQSQNYSSYHQQQRLPYMDEETYFSYPNLFTNGSNMSSHA